MKQEKQEPSKSEPLAKQESSESEGLNDTAEAALTDIIDKSTWTKHTQWCNKQCDKEIAGIVDVAQRLQAGVISKADLVLRFAAAQRGAKEFLSKVGVWGSGSDPFGRRNAAGERKLADLKTKLELLETEV